MFQFSGSHCGGAVHDSDPIFPGTPPDRVAILQKAVKEVMADPAFLAEARTAQIDMAYISAAEVTQSFEAYSTSHRTRAGGDAHLPQGWGIAGVTAIER